jgi:uncharacterized protein
MLTVLIATGALLLSTALAAAAVLASPSLRSSLQQVIPEPWLARLNAWRFGYSVDPGIRIAMPDGVRLAATLYLPKDHAAPNSARLATVMLRLPYHRSRYGEALGSGSFFARNGYAVLAVDLRGSGDSEGEFIPYRHAATDGAALLDWIVAQPWSNGRVGTHGCSALAETQFSLARAQHPAHRAIVASGGGGGLGLLNGRASYGGYFEGGVFNLASGFGWFLQHGHADPKAAPAAKIDIPSALRGLPVNTLVQQVRPGANAYDEYLRRPLADPWWRQLDYFGHGDRFDKPALVINSWGDQTVGDTLALAEWVRRHAPPEMAREQHVVIAPGNHCEHGESGRTGRFGDLEVRNAEQPYSDWSLQWFDRWLRDRGPGLAELPAYRFYQINEHRWLDAAQWPPADAALQRWSLGAGGALQPPEAVGSAAASSPAGAAFDEFRYDPMQPVPSLGGPVCCTGNPADRAGPVDQRPIESRKDVLIYTSPDLAQPLRIAGPLRAVLQVSSSAPDTDIVARLTHVWPDGRSTNIQEGALRLRYRDGIGSPRLLKPGEVVTATVDMRAIAYTLPAGHRLRLQIASSSFPRLERNLNTGGPEHGETQAVVAVNRIHHEAAKPSLIELMVLPASAVRP